MPLYIIPASKIDEFYYMALQGAWHTGTLYGKAQCVNLYTPDFKGATQCATEVEITDERLRNMFVYAFDHVIEQEKAKPIEAVQLELI